MYSYERSKLIELTSRAISINESLIDQEKEFVAATADGLAPNILKAMSDNIKLLIRKESLFIGAMHNYLSKIVS